MKIPLFSAIVLLGILGGGECFAQARHFANFESPQAHSITLSKNGRKLIAVNTPGNAVTLFSLSNPLQPKQVSEIPVGINPVSLAVYSDKEVWVVNHISDSISVVDIEQNVVVDTIQVGDRPGDVVFAGRPKMAFVTSMTERTVRVINPRDRRLIKTISIRGNDPRTLLASGDGKKVWVAIHRSGNQTTIVPHSMAPVPPKPTNQRLPPAPRQGIIVHAKDVKWRQELKFDLPDEDLFEIDTSALLVRRSYKNVGTILFNLAEHPTTRRLWVANTNARNLVRFEPNLKGHVVDNRITLVPPANDFETSEGAAIVDLNLGLDYSQLPNKRALGRALAQPTDIIFDATGDRAFVTSFGTDRVAVLNKLGRVVSRIDVGSVAGSATEPRSKRGPRALALHTDERLLYVLNGLSNSVSVIDVRGNKVVSEQPMRDPTPRNIREGRGYLFDAKLSGNGTVSCASCHVDGDRDGLAWDLGDPGGEMFNNGSAAIHPMKGPLLTQTLRGLKGERIFHWRADRPGLQSFNGTFAKLMGGTQLDDDDLETFVEYLKSIRFGPSHGRGGRLFTSRTGNSDSVQKGEKIFKTKLSLGREGKNTFRCIDCHIRPSGAGTAGFSGLIGQPTKAAQLRGLNERTVLSISNARINGFGFGADGSKPDLRSFLADSHRFNGISESDRTALQAFLLTFATETQAIVGMTRTIHQANVGEVELRLDLEWMLKEAARTGCKIVVAGVIGGRQVRLTYDTAGKVFRYAKPGAGMVTLQQVYDEVSKGKSYVSFLALTNDDAR